MDSEAISQIRAMELGEVLGMVEDGSTRKKNTLELITKFLTQKVITCDRTAQHNEH